MKTWRVFARFQLRVTGWKGTAWKGKSRKRGPGSRSGAGHPTYHVNLIKMKYEQAGLPHQRANNLTPGSWGFTDNKQQPQRKSFSGFHSFCTQSLRVR